jgi:hypothetical protein
MSNKSLLGKNTKAKTNKNYFNLISRNIAFEISNEKLVKSGSRSQATLKVKVTLVTSFSFNTNRKSDFHGLLRCTFILN